ncbi:MAG: M20/M25/M40 family metallo-hydrolase [Kangiellaceae bacterium]|jgi:hypothetical protein|nr:M20/M25/M40 family metallo-hydrolase [Kangiellaceae bacterium]
MNRIATLVILVLVSGCVSKRPVGNEYQPFSADRIKAHMEYLADDSLKGRQPGTDGYDAAARYVATQFKLAGLQPKGDNGSYFQSVPMYRYEVELDTIDVSLNINGKSQAMKYGKDVNLLVNPNVESVDLTGELVFVGYGLDLPDLGINSYRDIDVKDKIVVMSANLPKSINPLAVNFYKTIRAEQAQARGAKSILYLATKPRKYGDPEADKRRKQRPIRAPRARGFKNSEGKFSVTAEKMPTRVSLTFEGMLGLFKQLGLDAMETYQQIADEKMPTIDFSGIQLTTSFKGSAKFWRKSDNVVAFIPGSDPLLKDQFVVMSAHLDHLGERAQSKQDDKIYNGLLDNAAGVSTMIELAHRYAQLAIKPKRSIMFLAVTEEEVGLRGSEYFAQNPTIEKNNIVTNINLDMPVLTYEFDTVTAFGSEHSSLAKSIEESLTKIDMKLLPDPIPEVNAFFRSDQYRFVQQGIPSTMLLAGFDKADSEGNKGDYHFWEFYKNHYHKPTDDINLPILCQSAAKFTLANYVIINELANADEIPTWNKDSIFSQLFKERSELSVNAASAQ